MPRLRSIPAGGPETCAKAAPAASEAAEAAATAAAPSVAGSFPPAMCPEGQEETPQKHSTSPTQLPPSSSCNVAQAGVSAAAADAFAAAAASAAVSGTRSVGYNRAAAVRADAAGLTATLAARPGSVTDGTCGSAAAAGEARREPTSAKQALPRRVC